MSCQYFRRYSFVVLVVSVDDVWCRLSSFVVVMHPKSSLYCELSWRVPPRTATCLPYLLLSISVVSSPASPISLLVLSATWNVNLPYPTASPITLCTNADLTPHPNVASHMPGTHVQTLLGLTISSTKRRLTTATTIKVGSRECAWLG